MALNCGGALALPESRRPTPWLCLILTDGTFQLLAPALLAAQWGDGSVCFVLVVRNWGDSWGVIPGAIIRPLTTLPGYERPVLAVLSLPCVTWMSSSFLQVFPAPTSSEPSILGLLYLLLQPPSALPVWDARV